MDILNHSVELVKVENLKTHPDNPRQGNIDLLSESITTNGFWGTIVAQKSTGFVLAGNHRLIAAQKEKAPKIPVVWVDVDDEKAKRILIADNRLSDLGNTDNTLLAKILDELKETELAFTGTGYNSFDVDTLFSQLDLSKVDFPEFEESIADDVKTIECPECKHQFIP